MNEWMDVTAVYNMNEVSMEIKNALVCPSEWNVFYLKHCLSDRPVTSASLFNISDTCSVPNHKMTLAPPEEFKVGALQDSRALFC